MQSPGTPGGGWAVNNSYAKGWAKAAEQKEWTNYINYSEEVSTVKATHRPVKTPTIRNATTIDYQHDRDNARAERHAATYRKQMNEHYHHFRPHQDAATTQDNGIICDRGRRTPAARAVEAGLGSYDVLTNEWKQPPTNVVRHSQDPARVSIESRWRDMGDPPYRRRRGAAAETDVGRRSYDPICHTWMREPDAAAHSVRDTQNNRTHGLMENSGLRRVNYGNYDPILHNWRRDPVGVSERDDRTAPTKQFGKRAQPYTVAEGNFDPILNTWLRPPTAPDLSSSKKVVEDSSVTGHTQRGRGAAPAAHMGVYNPVSNQWTVPPKNNRHEAGLAFEPTTTFVQYSFRPTN